LDVGSGMEIKEKPKFKGAFVSVRLCQVGHHECVRLSFLNSSIFSIFNIQIRLFFRGYLSVQKLGNVEIRVELEEQICNI
jgi:hypothetical protein